MALILNIDTATEHASVCLSQNEEILAMEQSAEQKNHGSFVQPAIKKIMADAKFQLHDIDAVSVSAGPGSYTGLRVGLATAKGLCYVLKKPLFLINTLQVMAVAALQEFENKNDTNAGYFFCPMIDARRLEVFAALYNSNLETLSPPAAMILDEHFFSAELQQNHIVFFGSGSKKLRQIISNERAIFSEIQHHAGHLAFLAEKAYIFQKPAALAYCEPFYLKEFFTLYKKK